MHNLNNNKYDVLIFDCDGIIFDTTHLKLEAFQETLSEFDTKHIEEFTNYFKENFGRSRFSHARYFIENILNKSFQVDLYNKIIEDFSSRCKKIYDNAELCAGVVEILEKTKDKYKYVASGSNQSELRMVFKNRGIGKYFMSVYGSPIEKNKLVKDICSEHKNKKILMIGDSEADLEASENSNINFLFISRYSVDKKMIELAKKEKFESAFDLKEIINYI